MARSNLPESVAADPKQLWAHRNAGSSRELLLAALDAFAELGFYGATTRDIAKRAGMSPAAVYVHYASKLDLLQEIVEVCHEAQLEALKQAVEPLENATDRLRAYVEVFAAWNAHNHELARVSENELRALPPDRMGKIRALRRKIEGMLAADLQWGEEEEGFEIPDHRVVVFAIISMSGDVARWFPLQGSIDIDHLATLHGDLAMRLVKPSR